MRTQRKAVGGGQSRGFRLKRGPKSQLQHEPVFCPEQKRHGNEESKRKGVSTGRLGPGSFWLLGKTVRFWLISHWFNTSLPNHTKTSQGLLSPGPHHEGVVFIWLWSFIGSTQFSLCSKTLFWGSQHPSFFLNTHMFIVTLFTSIFF